MSFLRHAFRGNRPYVLSLVLLNLLFFGDVLFTANTFFYRDIGNFHQPFKKLVTEAYARGEWPLWNPYIQFGQPLLANPNAMAVYPTQILFHLLPFDWAFDINLVVHSLVAGLGAFYLARGLGFSPIAAFTAGVAYNFSGVVLSLVNVPLLAGAAGLLPWLAFLFKRIIHRPTAANLACSSLVTALFLLLAEPVTFTASLLFLAPFGIHAWITRPVGLSSKITAGALLIVLISGFCLAAVQLLPTQELVANSGRGEGLNFATASFWSVHPVSLTQMLFPAVWRDPFNLSSFFGSWSDVFFEEREAYIVSCYSGLGCLVLGLLGLFFSEKIWLKWTLAGLSVVVVLLALGKYTPLYPFLFDYLPPFRFGRYPAKYLITLTLCLALLSGLGIDAVGRLRSLVSTSRGKLFIWLLLIAGLLASSWLLMLRWTWEKLGAQITNGQIQFHYHHALVNVSESAFRQSALYLTLVVLSGAGLILFACFAGRVRAADLTKLAVILVTLDLLSNHSINPIVHSTIYERSPVTQWLLDRAPKEGVFRVYHLSPEHVLYSIRAKSDSLVWHFLFIKLMASPYTAAADHLQYSTFPPIDGLESFACQLISNRIRKLKDIDAKINALAQLNTGYILSLDAIQSKSVERQVSFPVNSDQLLHVYRLRSPYPRAFLVDLHAVKFEKGGYEVTDSQVPRGTQDAAAGLAPSEAVRVISYAAQTVDLEGTAGKPSLLVLMDSYYPGWRVWVNGREDRIRLVNRAFRGVNVPPGRYCITFRYDPSSFRYGLALTLSTTAAWVAAFTILYFRRHRSKRQPSPASETQLVLS